MKLVDLSGQTFSRWTVLGRSQTAAASQSARWLCRCECGNEKEVASIVLRQGRSKSCGCFRVERITELKTTHGHYTGKTTRTYNSWSGLIQRTTNPNSPKWPNYGGRGIRVCDRWLNSFENFLADMGERPDGRTIDRIDNDGNYEPSNCRWATASQQAWNKRQSIRPEPKRDLTGGTFGLWTVLKRGSIKKYAKGNVFRWLCHCACGTVREVSQSALWYRGSGSCGCVQGEKKKAHIAARWAA